MERRAAILMAEFITTGPWSSRSVAARIKASVGIAARKSKWPDKLAERIFEVAQFSQNAPRKEELAAFLLQDSQAGKITGRANVTITRWVTNSRHSRKHKPEMRPRGEQASGWQVPSIDTTGQLAEKLKLSPNHLDWLSDLRAKEFDTEAEKLRNYRYQWISKSSGGLRLLEAPKRNLKSCQRWIVDHVLKKIPTHSAAHAFCAGRSPVSAAAPHCGKHVVLRIDLCDFFPSIPAPRVAGVFRTAGYPSKVVSRLTGLCTNTSWRGVLDEVFSPEVQIGRGRPLRSADTNDPRFRNLFRPHLPQGSPASPMLANLCAWSLDCRLTGLAKKFHATYTRYADDLIFSGDQQFSRQLAQFRIMVCAICIDEGFEIRKRKTTINRQHQQQKVTGVVVNRQPSIARRDYDHLKAILHNCGKFGPKSQNRTGHSNFRSHLLGKVAWVQMVDAAKGAKLLDSFNRIDWTNGD